MRRMMRGNPLSDPTKNMNIRQGTLKGFVRPPKEVDEPTYEIVGKVERLDRRDDVNSRRMLAPGSPEYQEYYERHPELEERDQMRREAAAKNPQSRVKENPTIELAGAAPFVSAILLSLPQVVDIMHENNAITCLIHPNDRPEITRTDVDPEEVTYRIKAMALQLGAGRVRITKLDQRWVFKTDRWPRYGQDVELNHKYVICMAFPQDPFMIANATGMGSRFETYYKYSYASFVTYIIANYIKHLGWPVAPLSTFASPFLVVPTFVDAGIGEPGRCGYCVTKEFGNNWRPGAVATDMPLITDKPVDFGLQDFCEKCQICADACPSGSIPKGEKVVINGIRRWDADAESCARYWYKIGTSCSICQTVCPFNHPCTSFHNTIRNSAERFPWLRSLLIRGDRIFYPTKKKMKPPPKWLS